MKKIIIISAISILAIVGGYFLLRPKKGCGCKQGSQEEIINKLTLPELKQHILKLDEQAKLDGKEIDELREMLRKLIADSN